MWVLTLSMDNKGHKMSLRTQRFKDQLLTIIPLLHVWCFLIGLERIKRGEIMNFSAIFRLAKLALPLKVQWSWFCMLRIEIVKREFLPAKHYPKQIKIHAPLNNHLIRKGQRMFKSSKKRLLIFGKANSLGILAFACFYHTWIKDFSKSYWITCQRIYPEGICVNKSMCLQCNSRHTVRVRGANIGLQSAHVVCPTVPCQTSIIKAHRQQH